MAPGFRHCSLRVHPEHKGKAIEVLDECPCVDAGSVRYLGDVLMWLLDLSLLPTGDGPAAEGMILAAIKARIARVP